MEFPDLGRHCSEKTCKQLDFLPLKCDDVQVPVCPLCNSPVLVRKGEIPDVVVGEHIDRNCKYRPGKKEKVRVFTYRCSKKGCKKREMLPLACEQCSGNFCIQHRHPLDHRCTRGSLTVSTAGFGCESLRVQTVGRSELLSSCWLAGQLRSKVKR
ncbi:AN1-type zinc finger protein 2A isoform 3-T3 [Molossus nigricans]